MSWKIPTNIKIIILVIPKYDVYVTSDIYK